MLMGTSFIKHIDILEKVQMRATKLVDGFRNLEYSERLKRLKLPTLVYRRKRGDMIELFNHFHKYDKALISETFQPRERCSRTHDFQLHLPIYPKDGFRGIQTNEFYYRSPKLWNGLPKHVVNAKNINDFKNYLDDSWKDLPFKFDYRR